MVAMMLVSACRGLGNRGGGVQRHLEEHWARGGAYCEVLGCLSPTSAPSWIPGLCSSPMDPLCSTEPWGLSECRTDTDHGWEWKARPTGRGKTDPLGAPVEWEPPNPCMAGQRDGRRQVLSPGNHLDLPSSIGCWTLISLLLQV